MLRLRLVPPSNPPSARGTVRSGHDGLEVRYEARRDRVPHPSGRERSRVRPGRPQSCDSIRRQRPHAAQARDRPAHRPSTRASGDRFVCARQPGDRRTRLLRPLGAPGRKSNDVRTRNVACRNDDVGRCGGPRHDADGTADVLEGEEGSEPRLVAGRASRVHLDLPQVRLNHRERFGGRDHLDVDVLPAKTTRLRAGDGRLRQTSGPGEECEEEARRPTRSRSFGRHRVRSANRSSA